MVAGRSAHHVYFEPDALADDSSLQTAWVLDAAAGKQRKLVETKDATHTARWSPDGKSLAYLSTAGDVIYQQNLLWSALPAASRAN